MTNTECGNSMDKWTGIFNKLMKRTEKKEEELTIKKYDVSN